MLTPGWSRPANTPWEEKEKQAYNYCFKKQRMQGWISCTMNTKNIIPYSSNPALECALNLSPFDLNIWLSATDPSVRV